jgi:hypothetical protein
MFPSGPNAMRYEPAGLVGMGNLVNVARATAGGASRTSRAGPRRRPAATHRTGLFIALLEAGEAPIIGPEHAVVNRPGPY